MLMLLIKGVKKRSSTAGIAYYKQTEVRAFYMTIW